MANVKLDQTRAQTMQRLQDAGDQVHPDLKARIVDGMVSASDAKWAAEIAFNRDVDALGDWKPEIKERYAGYAKQMHALADALKAQYEAETPRQRAREDKKDAYHGPSNFQRKVTKAYEGATYKMLLWWLDHQR